MVRFIRHWWRMWRSPSYRWIKTFEKIDITGHIEQGIEDQRRLGIALNSAKPGEPVSFVLDKEVERLAGITPFDTPEEAAVKLRVYIQRRKGF